MDGFFSQLIYKCLLDEVAFVGGLLEICPQIDSMAGVGRTTPSQSAVLRQLDFKVGFQKSTPTQIRQLIPHISNRTG